jgi:hypothetical protein
MFLACSSELGTLFSSLNILSWSYYLLSCSNVQNVNLPYGCLIRTRSLCTNPYSKSPFKLPKVLSVDCVQWGTSHFFHSLFSIVPCADRGEWHIQSPVYKLEPFFTLLSPSFFPSLINHQILLMCTSCVSLEYICFPLSSLPLPYSGSQPSLSLINITIFCLTSLSVWLLLILPSH